jgi:hypothetical protein
MLGRCDQILSTATIDHFPSILSTQLATAIIYLDPRSSPRNPGINQLGTYPIETSRYGAHCTREPPKPPHLKQIRDQQSRPVHPPTKTPTQPTSIPRQPASPSQPAQAVSRSNPSAAACLCVPEGSTQSRPRPSEQRNQPAYQECRRGAPRDGGTAPIPRG